MSANKKDSSEAKPKRVAEADPPGGGLSRWRKSRRARRDAKGLLKEGRRILKKAKGRLKPEIYDDIRGVVSALDKARADDHYGRMREHSEQLDALLVKHVSFLRKSALREYAESIGIAVLIALLLRTFVIEAFKIPSGSMIPTLKIGDHIFVNKFTYGVRIPFTDIRIGARMPERGDVIVFVYPRDEDKDFIKRVVAVGGDTIRVSNNRIYINGKVVARRRLRVKCQYMDNGDKGPGEPWEKHNCIAYQEKMGDTTFRVIQDINSYPVGQNSKKIPEGHVFVMGDNRDNSHDSRAWGTVPFKNIKGRALIIWWSSGQPEGVRWGRFFNLVHAATSKRAPVTP